MTAVAVVYAHLLLLQEVSGEQGVNSQWHLGAGEAVKGLPSFKKIEMLRYLRHLIVVSAMLDVLCDT
jgi:hypothetical protein